MNKYTHLHSGHRQRLKEKVKQNGLKSLSKHEVLELLLTYTIPQKDTNELAHRLIENYHSFANVLNADYDDLLKTNGVGSETALFLTLLPQFVEIYRNDLNENAILKSVNSCVEFFRKNYDIKDNEKMYITCLNKNFKVLKTFEIEGRSESEVEFNLQSIGKLINVPNLFGVVIFHTHPKGDVAPSKADLATTQEILSICCMMNIYVLDHIILNETQHLSFAREKFLESMYEQHNKVFSKNKVDIDLLKKAGIIF